MIIRLFPINFKKLNNDLHIKKSYDLKSANSNWIKVIWKYIDITTESFNWQFD